MVPQDTFRVKKVPPPCPALVFLFIPHSELNLSLMVEARTSFLKLSLIKNSLSLCLYLKRIEEFWPAIFHKQFGLEERGLYFLL